MNDNHYFMKIYLKLCSIVDIYVYIRNWLFVLHTNKTSVLGIKISSQFNFFKKILLVINLEVLKYVIIDLEISTNYN